MTCTVLPDYVVLITGSRDWDKDDFVRNVLFELLMIYGDRLVIMHGDCPSGADRIARDWCVANGVRERRFPADWDRYGGVAGPIRNGIMVSERPNEVVSFMRNGSRGTTDCVTKARRAGLNVRDSYDYDRV